jgi:hypothetical protein
MATAYTARNRKKKAKPNSTMPKITLGNGGVPPMVEPCIEKNRTINGTENADGTTMIPAKSQKLLR